MNLKKFLNDSFKTLISNVIILALIQFILFPFYSNIYNTKDFGRLLTLYSMLTIFSTVIGNTLNNLRLIYLKDFKDKTLIKLFAILLSFSILIANLLIYVILKYYFNIHSYELLLFLIVCSVMTCRIYLTVFYRIELDYNGLLLNSIFYIFGVLVGASILFYTSTYWIIPLLFGESVSVIFILIYIYQKKYSFMQSTNKQNRIKSHYIQLLIINFMNTLINYFDRFLLYFLLGGYYVTIVFITTFISKFISSFISPLSSVLFSSFSKNDNNNISKIIKMNNYLSIIIFISFLLIIYPTSYLICTMLYGEKFELIEKYLIIGNLGIVINIIGNLYFPLNIMYSPPKQQSLTQIVYFIIYFIVTILFTIKFGINGFFIGSIIANSTRLILMLRLTYKFLSGERL